MADAEKKPPPEPVPSPEPENPEPVVAEPAPEVMQVLGLPMEMFVRGGTSTMGNDRLVAENEADANRRRGIQDQERLKVAEEGAHLYTNKLTSAPEVQQVYVLLDYYTKGGEHLYDHGEKVQCLADVIILPGEKVELMLIIVCPRCKENRPQGQAQIKIRQSNRHWELDTRKSGDLIMFDDGFGPKPYKSAGTIMDCEKFSCECGWTARIDKNRVLPE